MKLKLAYLHSAIQIPGALVTESTLSEAKVKGIELDYSVEDQVLYIKCKGIIAFVPGAGVKLGVIDTKALVDEVSEVKPRGRPRTQPIAQ